MHFHTHDDHMGHALERGLFDLGDLILMDAKLLQALGHVGGYFLEHVLWQVETLQLCQGGEGLDMDDSNFVVHQDQSLESRREKNRDQTLVLDGCMV